jgi:hypothetical protein
MKGSSFEMLMVETLLLSVFGGVVFAAAIRSFRKRID